MPVTPMQDDKLNKSADMKSSSHAIASTPAPEYILRGHEAQINTLAFADTLNILLSGDSDGFVGVWSLDTFRPIIFLNAHAGSVLTVASWGNDSRLLTHGRDNKIHVYDLAVANASKASVPPSRNNPTTDIEPLYTIETNALGYCKCSTLAIGNDEALVAVPATLDDNTIDIFHLPSGKRLHRSIGKGLFQSKTGTVMCVTMFLQEESLMVAAAYEDGRMAVFQHVWSKEWRTPELQENEGWTLALEAKEHKEPVMSICFDIANQRIWTVGADHLVVRSSTVDEPPTRAYKTAYPGKGAVAPRDDGKLLAIAGWDGKVRVHSALSFKPLAVLEYHRDSLYSLAFQSVLRHNAGGEGTEQSNIRLHMRHGTRRAWLAVAGKDERISLWNLYPPAGT